MKNTLLDTNLGDVTSINVPTARIGITLKVAGSGTLIPILADFNA